MESFPPLIISPSTSASASPRKLVVPQSHIIVNKPMMEQKKDIRSLALAKAQMMETPDWYKQQSLLADVNRGIIPDQPFQAVQHRGSKLKYPLAFLLGSFISETDAGADAFSGALITRLSKERSRLGLDGLLASAILHLQVRGSKQADAGIALALGRSVQGALLTASMLAAAPALMIALRRPLRTIGAALAVAPQPNHKRQSRAAGRLIAPPSI